MPSYRDSSVGGHVDAGEDYLTAAKRETQEEIGVKDIDLRPLGKYRRHDMFEWRHLNRFYKVYRATLPAETGFVPHPREVKELRWSTRPELRKLAIQHPNKCTANLVEIIGRFYS